MVLALRDRVGALTSLMWVINRWRIPMAKENRDTKKIDVNQVVGYLSHSFANTAEEIFGPRTRAVKGTELYGYQTNFCYLIDEIQRGPRYMLPKVISSVNDLIAKMKEEKTES